MKYLSICSGIEAATVAWHGFGWKPVGFSEIEPFPSAVLKHHYPEVPNLGDMTKFKEWQVDVFDVLVGGTPCQAFSVAGLRQSLDDARGNLSLVFCEMADHFDPPYILWENVPGVLNTKDNAFGCFLAGLAGEDVPLVAPGGKWTNAGFVLGPKRNVAWRVLDAQYFGLAQRRRRVFVVACPRDGADPREVLFEREGVQRHSAPSREKGEGTSATLESRTTGGGFPGTDGACGGHVVPVCFGGNKTSGPLDVATARNASGTASGRLDFESETFAVQCVTVPITHALKADGFDGSEDGTGRGQPIVATMRESGQGFWMEDKVAGTLRAEGENRPSRPSNVVAFEPRCARNGRGMPEEIVPPLKAQSGMTGKGDSAPCVAFDTTQITSAANYSNPQAGDPCHPLAAGAHAPCVAIGADCFNGEITGDVAATMGTRGSSINSSGPTCISFHQNQRAEVTLNDTAGSLKVGGGKPGQGYPAVCVGARQQDETLIPQGIKQGGTYAGAQKANTRKILRALWEEIGEEAFTEWGLGILISFYPQEILRPAVHGKGVRCPPLEEFGLVNYALSCEEAGSERAVLYLREAQRKRCTPFGWEPHEQRSRELAAYLSELSYPGTSGEKVLRDLWSAAQGDGLLRETLSAIQEMGRPNCGERQPARAMQVRRLVCEECEFLQGFPRNYTRIPWRNKPAEDCPDGPRYKALGNSMAVPVMRWIGWRIMKTGI